MDINDRIRNVGEYFAVFNVHDGAVCVGVRFPDKWTLFDAETICNEFRVQIKVKDGTTFFLCDINDGFDPVFDAVDFIIEQNKALEEKTSLLREKVEELRTLFEQESLDRLRTLQFVFDDAEEEVQLTKVDEVTLPIDIKKQLRKNGRKNEAPQQVEDKNVISVQESDKIVVDEPVKTPKRNKRKNNPGDSSLMNFVKDALDNE